MHHDVPGGPHAYADSPPPIPAAGPGGAGGAALDFA